MLNDAWLLNCEYGNWFAADISWINYIYIYICIYMPNQILIQLFVNLWNSLRSNKWKGRRTGIGYTKIKKKNNINNEKTFKYLKNKTHTKSETNTSRDRNKFKKYTKSQLWLMISTKNRNTFLLNQKLSIIWYLDIWINNAKCDHSVNSKTRVAFKVEALNHLRISIIIFG